MPLELETTPRARLRRVREREAERQISAALRVNDERGRAWPTGCVNSSPRDRPGARDDAFPHVATERTERALAFATIDGDEGMRRQTSRTVDVHPRRLTRE